MQISYTPEQEQLRHELRAYFARLMTPERRAGLAHRTASTATAHVYRRSSGS